MSKTQNANRPDLAALPIAGTEQYIAGSIFPVFHVTQKAGKMNYQTLTAKGKATQNREAGTALATTYLAKASVDWAVVSEEKRYGIPYAEVENYGGIEAADQAGAEGAILSVMDAIETSAVTAVLGGAGTAVEKGRFVAAVKAAKAKIKRYTGKTVLVLSQTAYDTVCEFEDVQERVSLFTSVTPADNEQIVALKKTILCMALEIDDILIGDDEFWGVEGKADRAALVKVSPEDINSHMRKAVFGKNLVYYPADGSQFLVSSFADDNDKANKYDAESFYKIQIFNAGACAVLTGISEENAVAAAVADGE
jgi:hypothetical protein